jgi:uncharacterized protein YkwD
MDKQRWIFDAMAKHPLQGRERMYRSRLLDEVAAYRCRDLLKRGYDDHVDPEGRGPNWWVRNFGYRLPGDYGDGDANNIESLCWGGDGGVQQIWDAWMGSEPHRIHLLGLNDTFAEQTEVGVGYAHGSGAKWDHYWAVLTAPPENG